MEEEPLDKKSPKWQRDLGDQFIVVILCYYGGEVFKEGQSEF